LSHQRRAIVVPADAGLVRLDGFLSRALPDYSRSQIQKLIRAGKITANDNTVKTGFVVHAGDVIRLDVPEPSPLEPAAEDIPIEILYQDPHLAVVLKPAGMVCHAGAGVSRGTLVNAVLHHLGTLESEDRSRPGIVHRLDKNTSGLLVIARTIPAHRNLAHQFKSRRVRKEYLAIVFGRPVPPQGTLDWPLGRDPRDRKKMSVRARKKRSAVTHYVIERESGLFSLLRIRIETGRTHQIRVHLSQLGYPVVGDEQYSGNRRKGLPDMEIRSAIYGLKRHLLHACRLEFDHPATGETMSFATDLPQDFSNFLRLAARRGSSGTEGIQIMPDPPRHHP